MRYRSSGSPSTCLFAHNLREKEVFPKTEKGKQLWNKGEQQKSSEYGTMEKWNNSRKEEQSANKQREKEQWTQHQSNRKSNEARPTPLQTLWRRPPSRRWR